MSDKTNEERNNDDELAPMVDGLSGVLCIFILIITVFTLSGIEAIVSGEGRSFTGGNSFVNYYKNTIYFEGVISLQKDDYDKITSKINSSGKKKIIFEASSSELEGRSLKAKKKLIYNLFIFQKKLNIEGMRITLKISEADFCDSTESCIKWSVE
ncbi:hypothetical protein [Enterobacter cloacae]|uniref:hypothetical protein n=1 Tax=Enterobacter cloacae TaxID=550 RepID=UPI000B8DA166|nr:hypothetical protein [Enterobacter cloacae]ASQ15839.1 hypothetical protein BJM06_a00195 [Enterobacter cloacae]